MKLNEALAHPEYVFGPETKIIDYDRNDFILAPEKTEKYLYYVISGAVGSFLSHNAEEICCGLHTAGHFFSEYSSFISQKVSRTYSKALQPARIAKVAHEVLQQAYKVSIAHQERGRKISERLFIILQERNLDLLTLTAEERYLKFIENRPEEALQIPLKYIASYLGMTPVSLSRIRKRLIS